MTLFLCGLGIGAGPFVLAVVVWFITSPTEFVDDEPTQLRESGLL